MSEKARAFKFTWNTWDENSESLLQEWKCKYLVYGYELAPSTGRPHLEGYIAFDSPRHLSAMRRLMPGCYVVIAKGTAEQNFDYASKDGLYFEKGIRPRDPKDGGALERERWHLARTAAREGRFEDIPDEMYVRYQASFKRMRKEDQPKPVDLPHGQKYGVWIYGPTGTGKSHAARTQYGDVYLKDLNKWWDDYIPGQNAFIDEVSPDHGAWLSSLLKKWVDRWVFSAEVKGGKILARPPRVIVTSNFSIDEVFALERDRECFYRRFDVIHMTEPYVEPASTTSTEPLL